MRRTSLFLRDELADGLKALKVRDGTPEAESIRRAVAAYLIQKGVMPEKKPEPKRKRR